MKKQSRQTLLKIFLTIVVLALLAILLTWLLEFRYYSDQAVDVANFINSRPQIFFFNAWLMFTLLLFLFSIIGSAFRAGGLAAAIILVIGYIHISKFASRGTPLLPEDFLLASEAASLSKFVSVDSLINLAVAVLSVIVIAEVLERWIGHCLISTRVASKNKAQSFWRRHLILPRLITGILALALFFASSNFILHHGNGRSERIDFLDTSLLAWNQTYNYNDNGFLIGFLYNCNKFNLSEPEDYDENTINVIRSEYQAKSESESIAGQDLGDLDYNIIILLNESFMDPTILEQYYSHSGGDITPTLHALMENYPSGYTFSPDYGGGTANIEFEAVTGLTNFWADTVPYTSILPRLSTISSIANFAKTNGYTTSAVHSYGAGMYKRNISLKVEGFDTFISAEDFSYTEHDGASEYINDRSTYAEIFDMLHSGEGQKLILGITMQNHTPYNDDNYDEHNFILNSAPSGDAVRKSNIETYFETLHSADTYLAEFISALEKSEEKTVLLFFGDHAPGLFNELNHPEGSEKFTISRTTPYFIYANFELPESASTLSYQLPTTTPNCLTNTLLKTLEINRPAFYQLLDEVCADAPVLTPLYFDETEPEPTAALKNYELVTYDLLGGEQYWLK